MADLRKTQETAREIRKLLIDNDPKADQLGRELLADVVDALAAQDRRVLLGLSTELADVAAAAEVSHRTETVSGWGMLATVVAALLTVPLRVDQLTIGLLTRPHAVILAAIAERPGATVGELKDMLGVTNIQNMSNHLGHLRAAGLVQQMTDGAARLNFPTTVGRELIEKSRSARANHQARRALSAEGAGDDRAPRVPVQQLISQLKKPSANASNVEELLRLRVPVA